MVLGVGAQNGRAEPAGRHGLKQDARRSHLEQKAQSRKRKMQVGGPEPLKRSI